MIFATGASRELEFERSRNAVLVAALSSAKGERERAEREAAAARLQIRQLEQQLQALHSAGSLRMLSNTSIQESNCSRYLSVCTSPNHGHFIARVVHFT